MTKLLPANNNASQNTHTQG